LNGYLTIKFSKTEIFWISQDLRIVISPADIGDLTTLKNKHSKCVSKLFRVGGVIHRVTINKNKILELPHLLPPDSA
jgi:hypothetical protein